MIDKNSLGRASIPAVNQYLQLAKAQQLDISSILLELALTDEVLADNSKTISGEKFQQLIASLINLSNDDLFGLHTAQYVQPGSYSVLGYITMNCETLGEAITKIQPFEKLVGDMGVTTLEQQGDYFKIGWSCQFPNKLVHRHMIDNCLASWLTFARYLTNNHGCPIQVSLTRTEPSLQQAIQYQELFNCPVMFNQNSDTIIFNRSLLELPLNKGDKQLLSTLEKHATRIITNLEQKNSIIEQTQILIQQNLASGKITQQNIAKLLGMSDKTLQRRLKAENEKFKNLVNKIRLQQAKQLLNELTLTIDQISINSGFAEPRSFYRWFQKLSQQTPGQYRKNSRNTLSR